MCPICFSSVAWFITSGVAVLGAATGGITIFRDRKIARPTSKAEDVRTREPLSLSPVVRSPEDRSAEDELSQRRITLPWQCKNK